MRKMLILLAALTFAAACGKESLPCRTHTLRFTIDCPTKAPGDKHTDLSTVMIILYPIGAASTNLPYRLATFTADPNGEEDYVIEGIEEGSYMVYAFGNYVGFNEQTSRSTVTHTETFSDYIEINAMQMGSYSRYVTVMQDRTVKLTLIRLASRIDVEGSIGFDFSSCPDFQTLNPSIASIAVMNVPTKVSISPEGGTNGNYYNDGREDATVYFNSNGQYNDSNYPGRYLYEKPFYSNLYGYPCSSCYVGKSFIAVPNYSLESGDVNGTDMVTKLTVAVKHDNGIDFYPIGIPDIGRNQIYKISNITIRGRGSDHPNKYVGGDGGGGTSSTESSVTFKVEVSQWTNVEMGQLSY